MEELAIGAHVLRKDESDGWVSGRVAALRGLGEGLHVTVSPEMVEYPADLVVGVDEERAGAVVDDLCAVLPAHEGTLLQAVRRVHAEGVCTVNLGGRAVVVVNPYTEDLPGGPLYGAQRCGGGGGTGSAAVPAQLRAHPFRLAERALAELRKGRNASVVVTGESGAGKTETAKGLLRYVVGAVGTGTPQAEAGADPGLFGGLTLCDRLLEVFGNAKTARNDNSSRYGKIVRLRFAVPQAASAAAAAGQQQAETREGGVRRAFGLEAAEFSTSLFEGGRVSGHASTDRNFHVFYAFVKHAGRAPRLRLLGSEEARCQDFRCLNPGSTNVARGVDDEAAWATVQQGLAVVGADEDAVCRILAAILHLSNIVFEPAPSGLRHDSPAAAAAAAATAEARVAEDEESSEALQRAAGCLGLSSEVLSAMFLAAAVRDPTQGGSVITVRHTVAQAEASRGGLSQHLYSSLFGYVLGRVNAYLSGFCEGGGGGGGGPTATLSILDLFGFEDFNSGEQAATGPRGRRVGFGRGGPGPHGSRNYLEQLFVNYANEKVQGFYVQQHFKRLRDAMREEGVCFEGATPFDDNTGCLDVLEQQKRGVLKVLEDECVLSARGRASDANFHEKLHSSYQGPQGQRMNPYCEVSQPGHPPLTFTVSHYPGPVTYSVHDILKKNKAPMRPDAAAVLAAHAKRCLDVLADPPAEQLRSRTARRSTAALVAALEGSACFYVRCVRPNDEKRAAVFDGGMVAAQLRCAGVLSAVLMRVRGPTRVPQTAFAAEFAPVLYPPPPPARAAAAKPPRSQLQRCHAIRARLAELSRGGSGSSSSSNELDELLQVGGGGGVFFVPAALARLRADRERGAAAARQALGDVFAGWRARRLLHKKKERRLQQEAEERAQAEAAAAAAVQDAVDRVRREEEAAAAAARARTHGAAAARVALCRTIEADRAAYAQKAHRQLEVWSCFVRKHDADWDRQEARWGKEDADRCAAEQLLKKRRRSEHDARVRAMEEKAGARERERQRAEGAEAARRREEAARRDERRRARAVSAYDASLREQEAALQREVRRSQREERRGGAMSSAVASAGARERREVRGLSEERRRVALLELSASSRRCVAVGGGGASSVSSMPSPAASPPSLDGASFRSHQAAWAQREAAEAASLLRSMGGGESGGGGGSSRRRHPTAVDTPMTQGELAAASPLAAEGVGSAAYTSVVRRDVLRSIQRVELAYPDD